LVLLNASILSNSLKENIKVSAYLKDRVNEVEMLQLRKKIEAEPFVRSTEYISKEEARNQFIKRGAEDPADILGDLNPLPASYEIGLNAAWVNNDSMEVIKSRLERYREIKMVKSKNIVVSRMNEQFSTMGLILFGISMLILIIAITLIDKTIRLAMYSNRFLIRSMQLVGATRWFIMKPYIVRGLINGLIAGLIAVASLLALTFAIQSIISSVEFSEDYYKFALLFAIILMIGMFISWWSTQRAVSKYLRLPLDELY
ncbi:MAG: cell division transport system permease protein, partial [Limisphaerales bacterium]